jgi:hypothetical protein
VIALFFSTAFFISAHTNFVIRLGFSDDDDPIHLPGTDRGYPRPAGLPREPECDSAMAIHQGFVCVKSRT